MEKLLDSRCRQSTNLFSFYLTELGGLNVLIKLVIIAGFIKLFINGNIKNKFIIGAIILMILQIIIHSAVILMSLPAYCDSSNYGWKPKNEFFKKYCHKKYLLYYSEKFWIFDVIYPLLVFCLVLYYIIQNNHQFI